jgi:hypothetical protein
MRTNELREGLGKPMIEVDGNISFTDSVTPIRVTSDFPGTGEELVRLVKETQIAMTRACTIAPEAREKFNKLISLTEKLTEK